MKEVRRDGCPVMSEGRRGEVRGSTILMEILKKNDEGLTLFDMSWP